MLTDPDKNLRKAELMPRYRAIDKSVSVYSSNFEIEAIASQKDVGSSEGDALIAVNEAVVVTERLHQSCRFLINGAVTTGLGTKNAGLHGTLIADTMAAAKHLDQSMLHTVDFGYRQGVRHLFGETLQQVMVASNGLLKGIHHVRTHQLLGWDHIVQIES